MMEKKEQKEKKEKEEEEKKQSTWIGGFFLSHYTLIVSFCCSRLLAFVYIYNVSIRMLVILCSTKRKGKHCVDSGRLNFETMSLFIDAF